jgi:hypothetical protein
VQAITAGGEGLAYNLTDDISGLQFSNVSPGGDETCSFTLHRPWHARNPEIDKGNILRVTDGIDVLWQGRVEEAERQTAEDETIDVTAYGLGARLKDTTFKEIFIDRELTHWNAIPNPRIAALGGNFKTAAGSFEVRPNSTGQPILALIFTRVANAGAVRGVIEAWYDASGIELGSVAYNQKSYDQGGGGYVGLLTSWIGRLNFWTTDAGGGEQTGPSIAAEPSSSSSLTATEAGKVYSSILLLFNAELAGTDGEWRFEFGPLVVFGRHGLTVQGTVPETAGFKVSQLVQNIASRAEGITTRVIAETSYIVKQSTFLTPTTLEDGINNVNQFENDQRTWGTWGPSSSLDNTTRGYFDYNEVDTEPSWYIPRERCDSLDLHSETATLFNRVQVTYTDVSGASKVVVRTAYVEDLAKMGVTRTFVLDAGASTEEDAQNLGDAFLALTGNFSPARGSVSITRPIKHKFRGMLKPHYMRADGSAIKMPDILPFQTLFTLDSTPDRRTIFPIKRVSVDCSERARPVVSIDVDQTNDALSAMQARLGLFTSLLDA